MKEHTFYEALMRLRDAARAAGATCEQCDQIEIRVPERVLMSIKQEMAPHMHYLNPKWPHEIVYLGFKIKGLNE